MKKIALVDQNMNELTLLEKIKTTENFQLIEQNKLVQEKFNFDGMIYLNSTCDLVDQECLKTFMLQSKPILCFYPISAKLAHLQAKQLGIPVSIAGSKNQLVQDLEYVNCPIDDFITDRYAKLITSSVDWDTFLKSPAFEKTFISMCKELVEMA